MALWLVAVHSSTGSFFSLTRLSQMMLAHDDDDDDNNNNDNDDDGRDHNGRHTEAGRPLHAQDVSSAAAGRSRNNHNNKKRP